MKTLLGKLLCRVLGHKRGRTVAIVANLKTCACPRCGRQTQYTVRERKPKVLKAVT